MAADETGARGPRAQARERTMARILELAREQLAQQGVAGLSVREIARGLGMVSSAVYRYVRSRDDLLTLLIADAYGELADAVDAALPAAGSDPRARFLVIADAMTRWALAHPERWTLLYGTPVAGYAAPAEATTAAGTRVMREVLAIAADGESAPAPRGAPSDGGSPDPVLAMLEQACAELGIESSGATALRATVAWNGLTGIISSHIFGQLGPDAVDVGPQLIAAQAPILADLIAPAPAR